MEKLVQPEHEMCRHGWPAVAAAAGGLLLVVGLSAWILNVAWGEKGAREFRELVLGTGFKPRGSGIPLYKLLAFGDSGGVNTLVAGPDENPNYHPLVDEAKQWARRNKWNARSQYDIGMGYWREYQRKQLEIEEQQKRVGGATAGAELARAKIEELKGKASKCEREALGYLLAAAAEDPANGFYRYTALELVDVSSEKPPWKQDLEARAERRVPGDTFLLLLYAERLQKEKRTQEALEAFKRVLNHAKTEMRAGLVSDRTTPAGPAYMGRAVDALQEICKDYEGWQQYVPDDAEVHLRLGLYLQDRYGKWRTGASGSRDGANDEWMGAVASAEEKKGIEAGDRLIAAGKKSALVMYLMGQAYRSQGDIAKSVEYMKKGLNISPRETEWWIELVKADIAGAEAAATGEAAERTKARDYLEDASEAVDRVVELEPANSRVLELARDIQKLKDTLQR